MSRAEALGHPVLVEHGADLEADVGFAAQRLALAGHGSGNASEVALGGGEQIRALAGALAGERSVAADDEPLARELGRGDASHVAVIEQRHLQGAAVAQRLDCRGAKGSNPVEPGRFDILADPRLGDRAAVADQDDMVETEALLQLRHLAGWVVGSAVLPAKTSMATGQPSGAQSRP